MNFLQLYRGPTAVTATVATLALVVVIFILAESHNKAVRKRILGELSRGHTESLQNVLFWDREQLMKHEEIVLPAVKKALEEPQVHLTALYLLSLKNCPRKWLKASSDQVVPLLKDNDDLVKYMAIYALYSNLQLAKNHLKAIKNVDRSWLGSKFTPIISRVESYVEKYNKVNEQLKLEFEKNLNLAKQGVGSWVEWAMTWVWWVWYDFETRDWYDWYDLERTETLDYRVQLCSRLLDDKYVWDCWFELTRTLYFHLQDPELQTDLKTYLETDSRNKALAEHMSIVKICAEKPASSLADKVLISLNVATRSSEKVIFSVFKNPTIGNYLPDRHPNAFFDIWAKF